MDQYAYSEVYRGIIIAQTIKGFWLFRDWPTHVGACSRFMTPAELREPNIIAMRNAIERMLNRQCLWAGDLRDWPQ